MLQLGSEQVGINLPLQVKNLPPLSRFNYIIWLQDLLDSTSDDYRESYDPRREVVGVDIGTGASAIYPLLGCRQRPNWRFIATEADDKSFDYARRNVARNGLEDRIQVLKVEDAGGKHAPLVPESVLERFERIDFLMTNPPFHSSQHSLLTSASAKSRPPNSVCTGSASEMITPGGEVGFVTRLIHQSLSVQQENRTVRTKVQWWSSMLGKLSSVGIVVERLRKAGCRNWAVKEFVHPGGKTRRWGVAWSLGGYRPASAVARGVGGRAVRAASASACANSGAVGGKKKKGEEDGSHEEEVLEWGLLPFPAEFEFEVQHAAGGVQEVGRRVDPEIGKLDLRWQWKPALGIGLGIAENGDCWSRKARRRKEQEMKMKKLKLEEEDEEMRDPSEDDGDEDGDEEKEPELVFKIRLSRSSRRGRENEEKGKEMGEGGVVVMLRWLQGQDHVLFESFCGWLKRKIDLETR
ncbi:hypothetical protein EPUS_03371 [Endocarpon pusillum Z07020]|uniref:Uncharacterized protein n=1 Tax=Endocarpon pusillum (strain Z07020 / HMAS-L-300199) TaxID=1263415 RepID=U1GQF1_ENDPU|nr:uncharacterized protein EPUS_03371 [Endocarpon pusillum Z07020]ERF74181.1 hypothetical protein EPUS_03371 [Endocarpon pusillum Z07020]